MGGETANGGFPGISNVTENPQTIISSMTGYAETIPQADSRPLLGTQTDLPVLVIRLCVCAPDPTLIRKECRSQLIGVSKMAHSLHVSNNILPHPESGADVCRMSRGNPSEARTAIVSESLQNGC